MFFCPGCGERFDSAKAYGNHRRACKAFKNAPAKVFAKRARDWTAFQEEEARRQAVRQAMEENNALEVVPVEEAGTEPEPEEAHVAEPEPQPEIQYRPSGLPVRVRRLPQRYRDELPPVPTPVTAIDLPDSRDAHSSDSSSDVDFEPEVIRTQPNEYGVYREYTGSLPSYTPDDMASLNDLCNSPNLLQQSEREDSDSWWTSYARSAQNISSDNSFAPFPNASTYLLMSWFHSLSNLKSQGELDRLVKEVILADGFDPQDLTRFSAEREARRLDSHEPSSFLDTSPKSCGRSPTT